jgi:hypothetical protein
MSWTFGSGLSSSFTFFATSFICSSVATHPSEKHASRRDCSLFCLSSMYLTKIGYAFGSPHWAKP